MNLEAAFLLSGHKNEAGGKEAEGTSGGGGEGGLDFRMKGRSNLKVDFLGLQLPSWFTRQFTHLKWGNVLTSFHSASDVGKLKIFSNK